MTTIYIANENSSVYRIIYGDSEIKTKESKADWPCNLCNHCTTANNTMFQITSASRFSRVCSDCINIMPDVIEMKFGNEVLTKLQSVSK